MDKLWEYRIEYKHNDSCESNHHYYNAISALQALEYQQDMVNNKDWSITTLKIDRKCPYSNEWIDETRLAGISVQ
tara:strand:+ start:604 stop:828 length:225 start_codon:yes stop_codon:yes gene_type:complete